MFALLLGAIGFYVGVRVEKSQVSSSSSSAGAGALRERCGGASCRCGPDGRGWRDQRHERCDVAGRRHRCGRGRRRRVASAACSAAAAASGAGATFGTVSSVSGNTLYITEANGNTVKVTLSSATKVTKNVSVGKNAVRPGDTVVVAGAKNSNGTVSATTLSDTGAGPGGGSGAGGGGSRAVPAAPRGSSAVGSLFGGGGG